MRFTQTQKIVNLKKHAEMRFSLIQIKFLNSDKDQISVILERLKAVIDKFKSERKCRRDWICKWIYFEQNSRVLNTNEIIENYISQKTPFTESLLSKSIGLCKAIPPFFRLIHVKESKPNYTLKQSHERFQRKSKLLKKQKFLEFRVRKGEHYWSRKSIKRWVKFRQRKTS